MQASLPGQDVVGRSGPVKQWEGQVKAAIEVGKQEARLSVLPCWLVLRWVGLLWRLWWVTGLGLYLPLLSFDWCRCGGCGFWTCPCCGDGGDEVGCGGLTATSCVESLL